MSEDFEFVSSIQMEAWLWMMVSRVSSEACSASSAEGDDPATSDAMEVMK